MFKLTRIVPVVAFIGLLLASLPFTATASAASIGGGTMQCLYVGGGGPGGQAFTQVHLDPPIAFGLDTTTASDRQYMYWHSWVLVDGEWIDFGWNGTHTGYLVPERSQAFFGGLSFNLTGKAVVYRYDQVQWYEPSTGRTYNAYSWGSQYCAP